ncbi:flavin reductase family protein [Actinopolymorpha pittospori]|uniref:Flavin reductase (DIM6/NTAB) family NADH-FMN oxidoreductase RutF n=1 Tax=Actinopolymorpha pittospori TaxID=648752 RepID=A0A927N3N0_9ACTN|nr:flavin reductase family protein [Actinopolymorpha pittospori]MBE1612051.1 flavin reductase (DIM6/NTAB) family NADH-FMN oxidoreductase RutF [Actinopolymorpha pittospori]
MTSCIDAPAGVSPETYRAVFRGYATGVSVVTADAGEGPIGFTASSLASVSLDPPLVSFALSTASGCWPVIAAAESVVVNLLGADQHDIAARFATRGVDRFAGPTRWTRLPTGEPLLVDAPSHLRGVIEHRYPAGDHHLVVARITHATYGDHTPLVYHDGRYTTVHEDGSERGAGLRGSGRQHH